jgi:hypothetical protein
MRAKALGKPDSAKSRPAQAFAQTEELGRAKSVATAAVRQLALLPNIGEIPECEPWPSALFASLSFDLVSCPWIGGALRADYRLPVALTSLSDSDISGVGAKCRLTTRWAKLTVRHPTKVRKRAVCRTAAVATLWRAQLSVWGSS